jgi:hypothetical protein
MVTPLEAKSAVRRSGKASAAFIFEAAVIRDAARCRPIDNILAVLGGENQPMLCIDRDRALNTRVGVEGPKARSETSTYGTAISTFGSCSMGEG